MSDPLRDRIADALYTAPAVPTEAGERVARRTAEHDADAVMGVVGPEIAAYESSLMAVLQRAQDAEAELARARTDLAAEIDDMDPDHTMRNGLAEHTRDVDPGHPGNAWWRAYCEVGGMLRALAVIDHARSTDE